METKTKKVITKKVVAKKAKAISADLDSIVYSQAGKEIGKINLPSEVFGLPLNEALVHQVAVSMMGNMRNPIAHTKNRGEVSGTGKKPWRQKGTGRARHGSTRSPIWVGGGVAHGPRNERNYDRKINKKMRAKALYTVLSQKLKDGEIVFVDSLSLKEPKTAEAKSILSSLSKVTGFTSLTKKNNALFVAMPERNEVVEKSFRNFGNMEVGETRNLNIVQALKYKNIVFVNPEKTVSTLSGRVAKKTAK